MWATDLGMKLEDLTCRNEGVVENWQSDYLLLCLQWPMDFQGIFPVLGKGLHKASSQWTEVRRLGRRGNNGRGK